MRDCPVPQLPLEIAIVEFCGNETKSFPPEEKMVTPAATGMEAKWEEVLLAVKPLNHSLVALLRASRPREMADGWLTLEVFYKFHKERLEEPKNREILEKVVSDILAKEMKIKFVLGGEKHGNV
ncbi:hypothetical protein HY440_01410 [Candidatus Microgenomates bacterium]|nr:hypothetical protein [Candidatus Microgenomates bacterium]